MKEPHKGSPKNQAGIRLALMLPALAMNTIVCAMNAALRTLFQNFIQKCRLCAHSL